MLEALQSVRHVDELHHAAIVGSIRAKAKRGNRRQVAAE